MSEGRRVEHVVVWDSIDVSRDLAPFLLGCSYTDNLTGACDDLDLVLEDLFQQWSTIWRPTFGDTVEARIRAEPWLTTMEDLRLGLFAHDKVNLKGPPRTVTFKAVSAPLATGFRRRKRTRSWQGVTLRQMAQDIADRAGLALQWDGAAGLSYKRREQKAKSDLEFLEEACKDAGRALKVTEKSIAIFDERDREKAASVGTIHLDDRSRVLSYDFDVDDSARYGSCRVTFSNPKRKRRTEHTYVDPTNPDGQTLDVRLPVDDKAHAEAVARGRLRDANRFASTGQLVVMGDPGLVAGVTFDLDGDGLSGKFIITKAGHHTAGGYTCSLEARRCAEAY